MGFNKGHKNYGGREVGSLNKVTKDTKGLASKLIGTRPDDR